MGDRAPFPFSLEAAALGNDVGFTADQRFDTKRSGGLIKIDGAKEIPVVGHPQRGHFIVGGFLDEVLDAAGPVEEAVLGVDVQVDEIGVIHNLLEKQETKRQEARNY